MTLLQSLTSQPINKPALVKRMLIGGAIGLAVILSFVLRVPHPDAAWGKYWQVKPILLTPIIGAMGGLFFYFMSQISKQTSGWVKVLAIVIGILGQAIALFMGIVLGLNGTLWD